MHLIPRTALAAAATAALLISAGTAAHAESDNVKDKASDVIHIQDIDDENGTVLGFRDSIATGVDMRGMRLKHGKKSVSVNLKFADLKKDTQIIVLFRLNGKVQPKHFLFNVNSRSAYLLGQDLDDACTVPLKTKTGRKGTIHAVIKRSCFGDPVKIKATAITAGGDPTSEDGPYDQDLLSPTQSRGMSWSTWLRSS
ncbi:MAG: hypothetical protein ABW004_09660 [Aeromicrobium sp.]